MNKKLLTLFAGYAIGLAVAMKVRKDNGTSRLAGEVDDCTVGSIIDEIVDIHRLAYVEVKNFFVPLFDDVKDFDGLKDKVSIMVDDFSLRMRKMGDNLQNLNEEKKESLKKLAEEAYKKATDGLVTAHKKVESFGDATNVSVKEFFKDSKEKLEKTYDDMKVKFDKKVK